MSPFHFNNPNINKSRFAPLFEENRSQIAMLFVFLITFGVYVLSPLTTSTDSKWSLYLSASILQHHDITLDEYVHLIPRNDYRVLRYEGHVYSYFPVAPSYMVSPMVWLLNKVFEARRSSSFYEYLTKNRPNEFTADVEKWFASFFCAVAASIIYLLARQRLAIGSSILIAFIFAFCTAMWSTASRALWQHGPSVLLLSASLLLITSQKKHLLNFALAGLFLSIAFLIRPVNSLSIFFIGIYLVFNQRKYVLGYAIGLLLPLLLFIIQNLNVYGSLLPPYFEPQRLGSNSNMLEAFWGNLFSPARGLFVFSPILLFAVLGIGYSIKRGDNLRNNISVFLLGIIIVHLFVISSFRPWYGGSSIGPRFTSDILPYLFFFFILAYEQLFLHSSHRLLWGFFVVALVVSASIHFASVRTRYPFSWNGKPELISDAPERIWDWSDLQFMRGLCPKEPNAPAPACWLK